MDIKINLNGNSIKPTITPTSIQEQKPEEEQISQISGKLHPIKDQDIIQELRKIPKRDRSRTYREALRKFFSDGGMK